MEMDLPVQRRRALRAYRDRRRRRRFDNYRITNAFSNGAVFIHIVPSGPSEPGTQGTPAFFIAAMRILCRPSGEWFLLSGR